MSTHPETVTLPHTGLQVPAKYPQIVSMASLPTTDGTALLALIRFGNRDIGTIEGTTNGRNLWFRPISDAFGPKWFDKFATQCRHQGQPVTRNQLMSLLVEEWQITDRLLRAVAEGQTLARFMRNDATQLTLAIRVFIPSQETDLNTRPIVPAEVADALTEVAARHGGRWQVWTGTAWQQLPNPETTDQEGSDR